MVAKHSIGRKALRLGLATLSIGATLPAHAGTVGPHLPADQTDPESDGQAHRPSPEARRNASSRAHSTTSVRRPADPNGDPLTFRISRLPRWATFVRRTGRLSGTPTLADVGRDRDIKIYVSDGTSTSALSFSLRVVAGSPPTIAGTPPVAATAGVAYSFQPTARDADGQALTFAIVNKPSWATFDAKTGRLSGTPPAASSATYGSVAVSVTDGASTASLPPFSITVTTPKNNPPTIAGHARDVAAGRAGV